MIEVAHLEGRAESLPKYARGKHDDLTVDTDALAIATYKQQITRRYTIDDIYRIPIDISTPSVHVRQMTRFVTICASPGFTTLVPTLVLCPSHRSHRQWSLASVTASAYNSFPSCQNPSITRALRACLESSFSRSHLSCSSLTQYPTYGRPTMLL